MANCIGEPSIYYNPCISYTHLTRSHPNGKFWRVDSIKVKVPVKHDVLQKTVMWSGDYRVYAYILQAQNITPQIETTMNLDLPEPQNPGVFKKDPGLFTGVKAIILYKDYNGIDLDFGDDDDETVSNGDAKDEGDIGLLLINMDSKMKLALIAISKNDKHIKKQ